MTLDSALPRLSKKLQTVAPRTLCFAVAGFAHLLLIVLVSFTVVAGGAAEEPMPPVAVSMVRTHEVVRPPPPPDSITQLAQREVDAAPELVFEDALDAAPGSDVGPPLNAPALVGFGAGGGGGRGGGGGGLGGRAGPSEGSEAALNSALEWLVRHRTKSGAWGSIPKDHAKTGKLPRTGNPARTGLALLCFLSTGKGSPREQRYAKVIERARGWLVRRVRDDGRVAPSKSRNTFYEQALGTFALAECLKRERSLELQGAVQRAVWYLEKAQDPDEGGWRYKARRGSDTSVTSWVILALNAARAAGASVAPETFDRVRDYVDGVTASNGTTGYMSRGGRNAAMNATGLFLRLVLGGDAQSRTNQAAVRVVLGEGHVRGEWDRWGRPLNRGGVGNLYQLYYAALALYQVGGEPWAAFNARVRDTLSDRQLTQGCEAGSWLGGNRLENPILATTFATLTLETYYRYERLNGPQEPIEVNLPPPPTAEELALERCAGQVQRAALANDPKALRRALADYARALPAGQEPHAGVSRLQRLDRFNQLQARVVACDREAPPLDLLEALSVGCAQLERERERVRGAERVEVEKLLDQMRAWEIQLRASDDLEVTIRDLWALVGDAPAEGPLSSVERSLVNASLKQAHAAFQAARARDAKALIRGDASLRRLRWRRVWDRLDASQRQQLEPLRAQLALARLEALGAFGRHDEVLGGAEQFRARFPRSPLLARLVALERVALLARVDWGEATDAERERLADHMSALAKAEGLSPDQALALSRSLLEAGRPGDAAFPLERALKANPPRIVRSRLHLGLARVARAQEDAQRVHRHLLAITKPISARLDARLTWCWLHRAQERPAAALKEYLTLLRALDSEPLDWWPVAEETAATYVETGDLPAARKFLEQLRRKDPSFGDDVARRKRMIALMRGLDARR